MPAKVATTVRVAAPARAGARGPVRAGARAPAGAGARAPAGAGARAPAGAGAQGEAAAARTVLAERRERVAVATQGSPNAARPASMCSRARSIAVIATKSVWAHVSTATVTFRAPVT